MNSEKYNELVLCFNETLMYGFVGLLPKNYPEELSLGGVSYYHRDMSWLKHVMKHTFYMPRGLVEDDSTYKQVIPYILISCGAKYFTYRRQGAEDRLSDKYSIGVGGHINLDDNIPEEPFTMLQKASSREFYEEIELMGATYGDHLTVSTSLSIPKGVLYDSSNDVGRVHFGVVYKLNLNNELASKVFMKDEGYSMDWLTKEELANLGDQLETWSKLAVGV